jgi:ketosteroid isomerase-like protein
MSEENVRNLRGYLETWDPKGDLEALHRGEVDMSLMSLIDPQVAYEDTVLPDHVGETYHGFDGMVRATEQWLEPFESVKVELERILDTGDRLVSIHRMQMKARHTGIEFESPLAYLWTFRDGKVIHIKSYLNPTEALEAVGLRE